MGLRELFKVNDLHNTPQLTLNRGDIHVWQAHFSAHQATHFASVLSLDEQQRANRYLADDVRNHFIIGRGILRTLIGRYLDISPQAITFTFGERGKPEIEHPTLRFNVSHSSDLLIAAFVLHADIGIDVEHIRPMREMRTVARDNFSTQEFARWEQLPDAEKTNAFYAIWTRKEAYIKATGDGFRLPLGSFSVNHDVPPRFLNMDGDDLTRWSLYQPTIESAYACAICTTQANPSITVLSVDPSTI